MHVHVCVLEFIHDLRDKAVKTKYMYAKKSKNRIKRTLQCQKRKERMTTTVLSLFNTDTMPRSMFLPYEVSN